MRWHRWLIAAKWTYSMTRVGRPGIMKKIRALICSHGHRHSTGNFSNPQTLSVR